MRERERRREWGNIKGRERENTNGKEGGGGRMRDISRIHERKKEKKGSGNDRDRIYMRRLAKVPTRGYLGLWHLGLDRTQGQAMDRLLGLPTWRFTRHNIEYKNIFIHLSIHSRLLLQGPLTYIHIEHWEADSIVLCRDTKSQKKTHWQTLTRNSRCSLTRCSLSSSRLFVPLGLSKCSFVIPSLD